MMIHTGYGMNEPITSKIMGSMHKFIIVGIMLVGWEKGLLLVSKNRTVGIPSSITSEDNMFNIFHVMVMR